MHELLPAALLLALWCGDNACFTQDVGYGGAAVVDAESNAGSVEPAKPLENCPWANQLTALLAFFGPELFPFGGVFFERVKSLGIEEVRTAIRSPWQNSYCERLIGSIRRECLDHIIVLNEQHLRRVLRSYADYYHGSRTHQSLDKDSPVPRTIEPPAMGKVIAFPEVGGLHHRYSRRMAA